MLLGEAICTRGPWRWTVRVTSTYLLRTTTRLQQEEQGCMPQVSHAVLLSKDCVPGAT